MGRQNISLIYGRVYKSPSVRLGDGPDEPGLGMVYIETVRSLRPVEDGSRFLRYDRPLVLTMEPEMCSKMKEWEENDIVFIKGTVTSKSIMKTSICPYCTDDDGESHKNRKRGNIVYVTPIYMKKVKHYDDKDEARKDIAENKEISNMLYVVGTLIRDPQFFTTKAGLKITQYPIAVNRKYTIRTDDPSIRTDWPYVKTYGERALDDKLYLHQNSSVLIDGFLQARVVNRKVKCDHCGKEYTYRDHTMEIVPYDSEYLSDFRSKDEVETEQNKGVEELKQMLYGSSDTAGDEEASADIDTGMVIKKGVDTAGDEGMPGQEA